MPTDINQSTCSRCGAISHGRFCINCDTCTCPSCQTENAYIKGDTQECVSCSYHAYQDDYCPCCSSKMGFEIYCGRAYQKGIPNMLGAGPQLIPLTCGTCNSTGIVRRRIGRGIGSQYRQETIDTIRRLKSLNAEKKRQEAQRAQKEESARKERQQKLEYERRERERKARLEREQKEREQKQKEAEERAEKIRERSKDCQDEVTAIRAQLNELKTQGSAIVKARFTRDGYTWKNSASTFKTLCKHYKLGEINPACVGPRLKAYKDKAQASRMRVFEVWIQDTKNVKLRS